MNVPARPTPSLQAFSPYSAEVTTGSLTGAEESTLISHQGLHALPTVPSSASTRQRTTEPSVYAPCGTSAEYALPVEPMGVTYSPSLVTPSAAYHSNRPRTELSASLSLAQSLGVAVLLTGRASPETQAPPGSDHTSPVPGVAGSELYSMTRTGLFLNFFQAYTSDSLVARRPMVA
ncbi:hypothetical protein ACFSTC_39750 [Nonomuraea ferruginea]